MRIVIAGGGVIGLAVAWRAASAGHDVSVVDPAPGQGASWVAGGMLTPAAEAHLLEPDLLRLSRASAERWSDFAARLAVAAGAEVGYTERGTLVVARDADDLGGLDHLGSVLGRLGLDAERVGGREARRLEPALAPSVRGALWLADEHQVDNRLLVDALLTACGRLGVRTVGQRVQRVAGPGAAGGHEVLLESGEVLHADEVVLATGAWATGLVVHGVAVELPVRPVKGQIVRVRGTSSAVLPSRTVRGEEAYIIPRAHGEIAIGATSEEKGFDVTVTAGAVRELLERARELVPGLEEAHFAEAAAGLRPGTPDNGPLIGRIGGAGGPIVATGHFRHGILLAPITADVVAALLADDAPPIEAASFRPDRFVEVEA